MIARRTVPVEVRLVEPNADQARWEIGAWVTLRGGIEETTHAYRVKGYNADGSLNLYGGNYGKRTAALRFRAVYPDRIVRRPPPVRDEEERS
jgi:hypothetical protein